MGLVLLLLEESIFTVNKALPKELWAEQLIGRRFKSREAECSNEHKYSFQTQIGKKM